MKKMKGFGLLLIMIIFMSSFGFADYEKTTNNPYEEGKTVGNVIGQFYKQKDIVSHENSNWEKVFENEKNNLLRYYYLHQQTNDYKSNFKKGFKDGFYLGYKYTSQTFKNFGSEHGEWFGGLLGTIHGKEDFYNNKSNNYKRHIPSDIEIINTYDLNNQGEEYKRSFIRSYIITYQQHYIYAFQMENIDEKKLLRENGILNGTKIGNQIGQVYGKIDFLKNKNNNWKNSLPTKEEIIFKFHLLKESSMYRGGFLVGYQDGFKKGYIQSFQNTNLEYAKDSSYYKNINAQGGDINSLDKNLILSIPQGTFYQETFFSLQKKNFDPYKNINTCYEFMNIPYEIKIKNDVDHILLQKPILLKFKYYGDATGGIYQLVHGEWRYLYSMIDKDSISTFISPGVYFGGIYAILDDPTYPNLKDTKMHWAKEEIYSFVRRHYVHGYIDQNFKPNQSITKEEFINLLKRIKKSDDVSFVNEVIDCNNFITYDQIEKIIQRLPENEDFKWDSIAEKILYEKYTRSKSLNGKNQYISRAETVYMLYTLQEYNKL